MKHELYKTICPGCGFGCGLYIREHEMGVLSVEHLKSNPVNQGKLCRFGMRLPLHYDMPAARFVESSESVMGAVKAAAQRLKKADRIAMLSVGNTTCEEHLAFIELARVLKTNVDIGVAAYAELPKECYSYLEGMPFAAIEKAKKIFLFIDPYQQYPLLTRRLLSARRNGAHITTVGTRKLHLAHEHLTMPFEEHGRSVIDSDSLVIADLHPHSDIKLLKYLLNLTQEKGASLHMMKPFVNSEGAIRLIEDKSKMRGLSKLMDDIRKGEIKTLVLLDSDPIKLMPDMMDTIATLRMLDDLIVISSMDGPVNAMADVVIATECLYKKAGSFINAEGRLQDNSASYTVGIDAISSLCKELGATGFDYRQLHAALHDSMIEALTKENRKNEFCLLECGDHGYPVEALHDGNCTLQYLFNPFMWFDQPDDNDFVLLNMNMVKDLGLKKGGMVQMASDRGSIKMHYRVEKMPDGLILSCGKLPVATGVMTSVKVEGCK